MFKTSFRLPDALRSSLGVFFAAFLAVALVIGGQSLVFNTPVADAATTEISVSPKEHTYNKVPSNPMDTLEFTIEEDATINELDFKLEGTGWLQGYHLWVNGKELPPKITPSGSTQRAPLVEHKDLNFEVKQGDKVKLKLRYTAPTVSGSVALTLRGTLPEPEQPSEPEVTSEPETEAPTEEPSVEPTTDPESEKPEDKPTVGPEPTTTEETTSKPTETPASSVTSPQPSAAEVTPAAPEFVDPSTAEGCVEKGYVTIPETKGVDYYLNNVKKGAGLHVYEQTKPGKVQITARAKDGFVLEADATAQWDYQFSGEVKDCNDSDNPAGEGEKVREFTATGNGIEITADQVDPKRPNAFTARVEKDSRFESAKVRIETNASFLTAQAYRLTIDKIEDGVTFARENVKLDQGVITFDVVPMKDGKRIDSALIPEGAVFTFTNNLSRDTNLKVNLEVNGTTDEESPEVELEPVKTEEWLEPRYPNPPLPERCGLRVAIVADLSRSLMYADTDAYLASKDAANSLIDSLAGTPVEMGIYNFASAAGARGTGTTRFNDQPYASLQSKEGVETVKAAVNQWNYDDQVTNRETQMRNDATNWEAGLNQVARQKYDLVYFITDGMPTLSEENKSKGIHGEFVQESALNSAIKQANELKKEGTRIVPIMVTLSTENEDGTPHPIEGDQVLKNIRWVYREDPTPASGMWAEARDANKTPKAAKYKGTNIIVNFDLAVRTGSVKVSEKVGFRTPSITKNREKWTHGYRSVTAMGEDISGNGDTIRVERYSLLTDQMKAIGQELAANCNGFVTVKKNIVDKSGKILEDGAPGWDFTLTANDAVIDSEFGADRSTSMKSTSGSKSARGTASWRINSDEEQVLTLEETQQTGFNLFKTDSKNAVCTQEIDGKSTPLEVTNKGDLGFKVKMAKSGMGLASVSCVVSNYEEKEAPKGQLTFKKAKYVDGKPQELIGLGGATFEIYPAAGKEPDFDAGALYTIAGKQTEVEIDKTGTFFLVETKAPDGLNLLPKPVAFNITEQSGKLKVSVDGGSNPFLEAKNTEKGMELTVNDTLSGKLPKSGGRGFLVWALFGLLMSVGGFFWIRRRVAA